MPHAATDTGTSTLGRHRLRGQLRIMIYQDGCNGSGFVEFWENLLEISGDHSMLSYHCPSPILLLVCC